MQKPRKVKAKKKIMAKNIKISKLSSNALSSVLASIMIIFLFEYI